MFLNGIRDPVGFLRPALAHLGHVRANDFVNVGFAHSLHPFMASTVVPLYGRREAFWLLEPGTAPGMERRPFFQRVMTLTDALRALQLPLFNTRNPNEKESRTMLVRALTAIIGVVARGPAAKAIAGGLGTALLPIGNTLVEGFSAGLMPSFEQIGLTIGQAAGAFVVGYVVTWLSPKNAEA